MSQKELLEIVILVIGGAGGAACAGFAFATKQYLLEVKDFQRQTREDVFDGNKKVLDTIAVYANLIRKLQQNDDNLLNQIGVLKCDVRDNKAVLEREGLIHPRSGFPEENIARRTDWTVEDA